MTQGQVSASEAPPRRKRRMRITPEAEAQVHIDAQPERVWEVVADVTRQDRWSCEATSCVWLSPAHSAVLGARFRGDNRRGFRRWTRTNEIIALEPRRTVVWQTLATKLYPDSTSGVWSYRAKAQVPR